MAVGIGAIVLTSARVAEVVEFYSKLGLPLVEEDHGDGIVHWACEIGEVHFAIFPSQQPGESPGYHCAGSTFCGFVVDDVTACLDGMRTNAIIVQELVDMPWGTRAVVLDPDGRPVEVFQAAPTIDS